MASRGFDAHPEEAHDASARAVFWAKSRLLIARRLVVNALRPRPAYRRVAAIPASATLLAEDESRLYTMADPRERALELGKVQNLRMAAAAIDGIALSPGEIFSYWRAAGRASRAKGYVVGRELRQGCVIPTVGGGICQLTNALSRIAHRAGLEIVERLTGRHSENECRRVSNVFQMLGRFRRHKESSASG